METVSSNLVLDPSFIILRMILNGTIILEQIVNEAMPHEVNNVVSLPIRMSSAAMNQEQRIDASLSLSKADPSMDDALR